MLKLKHGALEMRSLLTETLPYEVPVIFSNDKFHSSLSVEMPDEVRKHWLKIGMDGKGYSIPYNYEIAKDDLRTTTLSIVHPRLQERMSEFYELHHASILSHCANSKISLRYPAALASPYVSGETTDEEGRLRLGVAQQLADEGQPDVSHLPSYFSYAKYNLLGKFIASREFMRLEGRYLRYRSLDISKCFFNLYSHTISWAVKEKRLAKENTSSYSFEAEFDKVMQLANYNETNGIVVGPEISRIFAEIVLQDVDGRIVAALKKDGLSFGSDYDIRRYVDDYFVFSNAVDTLDMIEATVRRELEYYKLYVNDRKVATFNRPFVSSLSIGRQDINALLRDINHTLADLSESLEVTDARRRYRRLKALIAEVRLIVAKYEISFSNISAWVMSRLRRVARRALRMLEGELPSDVRPMIADLGSGLIGHSQKMTVAARATAERKTVGHRS